MNAHFDSHQAINDELNNRFFHWRLADAKREVESGYPFISKMKSPYITWTWLTLQLFSQGEQMVILTALIKRKTRSEISGDLTLQEQNALNSYSREKARIRAQNEQIQRLFSDATPLVDVNKKDLRERIIREMQSVFSSKPKRYDGDLLYQFQHGQWLLDTWIEVESVSCSYFHAIQYGGAGIKNAAFYSTQPNSIDRLARDRIWNLVL